MTHFIYPEIPGFEEAGGLAGPKVDYNEHPEGDMAVAEKYMKLAGYPSGKYTGGKTLQVVGSTGDPAARGRGNRQPDAEEPGLQDEAQPRRSGGHVLEVLRRARPKRSTSARTSAGSPTSATRRPVLDVPFNGKNIITSGNNSNWGQVNNPTINAAMDSGRRVVGTGGAREGVGGDRPMNSSPKPPRSRTTGTSSRTSSPRTSPASATCGTGPWDYSFTSLK